MTLVYELFRKMTVVTFPKEKIRRQDFMGFADI